METSSRQIVRNPEALQQAGVFLSIHSVAVKSVIHV